MPGLVGQKFSNWQIYLDKANNDIRLAYNDSYPEISTGPVDTNWHYFVFIRDGNSLKFYIDDIQEGNIFTNSGPVGTTTDPISIAWQNNHYFSGLIDEVRISKGIARNAAWRYGSYNNQENPEIFYAVGTEESVLIQITPASSSGDEGTTPADLELSLSAASGQDVSVDYALSGTATGGGTDYTLAAGTATINAGSTTTNISAAIVNDSLDELDETIIVTLSSPSNATLSTNTVHTYTINDNDDPPTIQFTSTASSGAEGTTPANLELSLSAASGLNVSVDYTLSGTATGGGTDYTLAAGTATINAGNTTTDISAVIVNDSLDEADETIIVTISSPSNATLDTNTVHTYTINDNDATPTIQFSSGTWPYRKKITIDNTQVDADLTNFPVLIHETDTDLKYTASGGRVGQSDGGDILFTKSDGTTKLDHEIEKYVPTTGELVAWVEVDSVSSSADTDIYMYYGNADAADQWNIEATWDSNYELVLHMKEDPSGTAPQMIDSTSNDHDATSGGSMSSGDLVAGQVGDCLDFDGSDDKLTIPSHTAWDFGTDDFTVDFWFKRDSTQLDDWPGLVGQKTANWHIYWHKGNSDIRLVYNGSSPEITTDPVDTAWHYFVFIRNGDSLNFYIDGLQQGNTFTNSDPVGNTTDFIKIGSKGSHYLLGLIDEVRISKGVARSPAWRSVSHINQEDPSTFYNVGTEESVAIQFTPASSSGDEGTTPADLELTLSAASGLDVSVAYALSGTATINAGNTTTDISATIADDSLDELDETIIVTISSPSNATLDTNTVHTYTINDNDTTPTIQLITTPHPQSSLTLPAPSEPRAQPLPIWN
jgi:hypothetical protein